MGRLIPALCIALLAYAGSAHGQTSPDDMARRHFESGAAYLQESDYENALKAFEKAYELSKRPAILLNLATVHERLGNLQRAVEVLEQYLELAPDGEHAATAELRVANLKKRLQAAPPDAPPVERETSADSAPEPAEPPPPAATKPASEPPPGAAPKPNRVPAYVFLGVGAAAAGGAVVTGLLAQGEHDDAADSVNGCSPTCTDDQLQSGRTLAVVSTVLTGVSLASVAVGVILFLTDDAASAPESVGRLPGLHVTAAPDAASASATWRF
jgi:tetratricopeptide (TPR) repeat protein